MCNTTNAATASAGSVQPVKSAMKNRRKSDTDLLSMLANEIDVDDYTQALDSSDDETTDAPTIEDDDEEVVVTTVPIATITTTTTTTVTSTPKPMKKTVSFGNLEELSFPVVEGDPNLDISYPMALGWDSLSESTHSVDDYEVLREGCRRPFLQLRTYSSERRRIILRSQVEVSKRRKLQRRNSIANGMIGRDKRRNRVQEFLGRFAKSSK